MKICFFLGSNIRSGANLSLLRHAAFLHGQGHNVCVVFQYRFFLKTIDFIGGTAAIPTSYLDRYPSDAPLQDVVVTNWWQCAYDLHRIPARLYGFYRHGDEKALYQDRVFDTVIDATLRENFLWLGVSDILTAELAAFGHRPILLPNGVDCRRYAAAPSLAPKQGGLRVLVEGPVSVGSKRVDATVNAIDGVPGVEIVHMAADGSRPAAPVAYALGAVDHDDTAGVYASCDVILKLSALESFAMPVLEQFAAGGTAVVTAFTGHEQYISPSNAIIVDLERPFEAAAAAVEMLRDHPGRLTALKLAARATAQRFDWPLLHARFAEAIADAVRDRPMVRQAMPFIARYVACQSEIFALWAAEQQRRQQPSADTAAPGTDRATVRPSQLTRSLVRQVRRWVGGH